MPRPTALSVLLAIALPLLAGCGGGVDERNFSRLKVGMTAQEVEAILGKGGKPISSDDVSALMRSPWPPTMAGGRSWSCGPEWDPRRPLGTTAVITVIYRRPVSGCSKGSERPRPSGAFISSSGQPALSTRMRYSRFVTCGGASVRQHLPDRRVSHTVGVVASCGLLGPP